MKGPQSEESLSVEQLSRRIPFKAKTIRNLMCQGVFVEGIHLTRLTGRPIFLWSRVQALLKAGTSGTKVRVDARTNKLYLDIHFRGRRRRIISERPDPPKNRKIHEVKAKEIDRELFLGTFDPARHIPREEEKRRVTFRQLYQEWRRKKANEVSPLTLQWYADTVEGKILPFWGVKGLDDFSSALFDQFKARLFRGRLLPRSVNIVLMVLGKCSGWT